MKKACAVLVGLLLSAGIALAQTQGESLGEIARRLRAERQKGAKATRVYTNDDLGRLRRESVSVVGRVQPPPTPPTAEAEAVVETTTGAAPAVEAPAAAPAPSPEQEEQTWRKRFVEMHAKIATAEKELELLQRELQLQQVQFYQDPNEAMRQQYSRGQINETRQKIQDKQAEIERLRQELRNLEDELRRAGGKPAWARP